MDRLILFIVCNFPESKLFVWQKTIYSINTRTVVVFCEIGQGYEGLQKFGTLMNMPGSFSKSPYNYIKKKLNSAYAGSAKESMENDTQEVWDIVNPNAATNDVVDSDTDICIDGSWQKKGHNSLNRVVTGSYIQKTRRCLMCQYFPGFVIHVPNGNDRKEHQSMKNGK